MIAIPRDIEQETMRCPICRAEQEWSDSCRRCRGDLSLLRACRDRVAELALACFQALSENRPAEAYRQARELAAIDPSLEAQRLLAASAFAVGDYAMATQAARAVLAQELAAEFKSEPAIEEKRNEFRFTERAPSKLVR